MQIAFAFLNNQEDSEHSESNALLPDFSKGSPEQVWKKYFKDRKPSTTTIYEAAEQLHQRKNHRQLIALMNQAILSGKAEPLMYEVLAISMKLENYTNTEIERVLLSNSDFTVNDFPRLMLSGAYLNRMGIPDRALKLYRQASEQLPTQQEPYLFGFKIAKQLKAPDEIAWTAAGILTMVHEPKYRAERARAKRELENIIAYFQSKNDSEQAKRFQTLLDDALQVDLSIKVMWSGDGDIDLRVKEPAGTVCSTLTKLTDNGGAFLYDGFGPNPKKCYEEYRCGKGMPGLYEIQIKHIQGNIVGKRVQIHIITNQNSPDQAEKTLHVTISGKGNTVPFRLKTGRRTNPDSTN